MAAAWLAFAGWAAARGFASIGRDGVRLRWFVIALDRVRKATDVLAVRPSLTA